MNVLTTLPKVKKEDFDEVDNELAAALDKKWNDGLETHGMRTANFDFFTKVAHNLSIFEKARKDTFSEGSTQTIKRKIRSQTIQRVPDGEIVTQYDKNSIEQAIIDYLFQHKVLTSEFDGKDMMKQLWKTFNASYDYGFGCVRTGFEQDLDGDPRISYTLIPYNDVIPSPDCKSIEEADWYIVREYLPISSLKTMIDWDTGTIEDPTWDATVARYIVENEFKSGAEHHSLPLADKKRGVTKSHSVEVRTYYCRGAEEFITYVPDLNVILRKVKNYDPRKDVPIHFLILEPDPEFPYGCSSIMWTLAQQQYADAFQSISYQTLMLSLQPPLMVFGNLTNPKLKMKPGAIWPMGTNPNNKIEPYRVETTTLTQYGSILENISARMMQSLNITDATVASDANVARYSATPQGVEQQHLDKTITINQYQKRIEIFFQEWANHALRSYINSMTGEREMTVDEKTRRRILSIEQSAAKARKLELQEASPIPIEGTDIEDFVDSIVLDDNKVLVDFGNLSSDLLSFEVRSGSLIENEREVERNNIQEMLVSTSQMMGNISDENRPAFENVIMQLVMRLCELSDIDISASVSSIINEQIMMKAIESTMGAVLEQKGQIEQLQQALMPQQQQLPPEAMGQQAPMVGQAPPEMGQAPMEMGQMPVEAGQMPPEMGQPLPPETGGMPEDMMPPLEEGEEMPM